MRRQIAGLAILCMLGLTGCSTSARYVTSTSNCGIIAIPTNTDKWPFYYHKQAEELMLAKCPQGYVIEHEEEFIPGANKAKRRSDGSSESAGLFSGSEWRIYYRRKDAPEGVTTALMAQPAPRGLPLPATQTVGLTPVTTPLANTPGVNMTTPGVPLGRSSGVVPASQIIGQSPQ
jgi:hypothetical protein